MARWLTIMTIVFAVAIQAAAQQVQVAKPRDVSYAGEPVTINIIAQGFAIKPPAECVFGEAIDSISIRSAGTRHKSSSFSQLQGRKIITKTEVTYIFIIEIIADKAGKYQLPPFTVTQDKTSIKTEPFEMSFKEATLTDDMRIELTLPSQPIYPGQRVPVTVSWWYAGDLENASDMSVRVPLFNRFEFIDEPIVRRRDSTMTLHTKNGNIRLKAVVDKRMLGGVQWVVLSSTRQMLVKEPGEYEIAAPAASIKQATKWARDFFGSRAVQWERQRSVGKAYKLIVKPLPLAQAPAGFAGAVGEAFDIEVAADRTVVQAGDPVKLTITLRGSGDLETASLPKLVGKHAMNPRQFRVPETDMPGTVTEQGKQFVITARVLDDSVAEIPPIQYAWFNPVKQVFMTAQSDPIALRVTAARMVTAGDVVGGKPADNTKNETDVPGQEKSTTSPRQLNLTGADLAIEPVLADLLVDDRQRMGGRSARLMIYIASIALLGLAWLRRRAAQVDPAVAQRKHLLRKSSQQIARAAKLDQREAATQIAAALRQISPHANTDHRREMDQLIATCDALSFAPQSKNNGILDPTIVNEAKQIAQSASRSTP